MQGIRLILVFMLKSYIWNQQEKEPNIKLHDPYSDIKEQKQLV